MTRPATHRKQYHGRSCGTCKYSHLVAYKLDLLCFHGDTITVTGKSGYPVDADYVHLNGDEVGMMDGDEYDLVWGARIIDPEDVCDVWEKED